MMQPPPLHPSSSPAQVMNMNHVSEGEFIRRTAPVAFLFALLAQAVGLIFTLGGSWMPDRPMATPPY